MWTINPIDVNIEKMLATIVNKIINAYAHQNI